MRSSAQTASARSPPRYLASSAARDDLEKFELSTIRDRVTEANIVLPSNADEPIKRMYCLKDDTTILVGLKPGFGRHFEPGKYGDQLITFYDDVIPLNESAVAHVGSRGHQSVPESDLTPVTLNIILGKKQLPTFRLLGGK